ncbi:MarP family serine protease [Nakamurella flavida]|uniref:MarP family serine protease n=1 Tax=Nakamurella flavida TaxID=363630 RepID=A0A939C2Q6_9ACTN|nr:MarP family serine protease [Nakamurella flavida]MBM9476266.1 MarP family serine protease [Nakamurella flavida]MDP9779635.1 S1-C subfamily serine protease [Nakamurella flavida]
MNVVDVVVVAMLLLAAVSGFRQGLITAMLTLLGAVGGAVLAIRLSPMLMTRVDDSAAKVAIGVACVVVGVGAGELIGSAVGRRIARRITWRPAKAVERTLGLLVHTAAVLVVIWMVAVPLASVPYPAVSSAIRSSEVLGRVDTVMPAPVRDLSDGLRTVFDDSGFPAILDPLAPTPDVTVPEPDPALAGDPALQAVQGSVLKIRAQSDSCSRTMSGTGFVIGPERLLTNAHVVAGSFRAVVETGAGTVDASVVVYDPERDLAVLAVPGLTAPALTFADTPAGSGDDAVVAGYPLGGPYTLGAARISSEFTLRGPDIYAADTVQREVYTVRGSVRPGNSGGPLLDPDGTVLGVVFGASVAEPEVGFALTAAEVAPVVAAGLVDDTAAGTGACTAA